MNWDIVKGNWKEFKGKVQEEWGELTGDELDRIEGQREQLVGLVQQKYGWAREDALFDKDMAIERTDDVYVEIRTK